jgi:hypothetical protein
MEKEYKTKYDRLKSEVNEIFKAHHPFDVFSKKFKKFSKEETKEEYSNPYTTRLINNKDFYFKFAQAAFDGVMYDISLYNMMKTNFSKFCSTILQSENLKQLRHSKYGNFGKNKCDEAFTSKIFKAV